MTLYVRRANFADVTAIANIHRQAFPRQSDSIAWVTATLAAEPRMFVFLAEFESFPVGYMFWAQKSGIRPEAVIELDQVAVLAEFRGRGFAEQLIRESLSILKAELGVRNQSLKSILVSTRFDSKAQRLYSRVLGAKVVATINNLYSATEVFMVAERPDA